MHKQREDLDLIFRRTTPEIVLANIMSKSFNAEKASLDLSFNAYTYKVYDHFAVSSFPEYSPNETQLRHAEIQNIIDADKENGIFSLLYKYAGNILMIENNEPVCKMEEVLNWNSISSRLGQDIFVTAWLAKMDIQKRGLARIDINFCWAPIIKTDDRRLNAMVEQKLAENHFHHHGSTQSFSLSWACLMNHPNYISRFFKYRKQFRENLNFNLSRGVTDNVLEWKERIAYAALIRAMLFERCLNLITAEEVREKFKIFHTLPVAYSIKELTEPLRLIYGAKFEQPQKTTKCLDYAICPQICFVDEDDHERILAGERAFLYHCFAMQFSGKFTVFEASLFYFYILLKSNFRSELIQVNKRVGFDNFSEYQNRKNQFFENVVEYWVEAQRIGVCGNIKENNLASLETRIMPKNSSSLMQKEIARLDKLVKFADKSEDFFNVQFYVIHFGKNLS